MPVLSIVTRDGIEHMLEGKVGFSVMELIRANGLDELVALCGGCCSCATCHVYVEPSWSHRIGSISDAENDLLESSRHRCAESRLSCQILFNEGLDGLHLAIAPEE
jgi:ferredoxin, 2Fe-2S